MSNVNLEKKRKFFNSIQLLIVDDEEGMRDMLSSRLTNLGFKAVTAANGLHALQVFKSTQPVDLVLCDLSMPGMDGVQLHREIKEIDPNVAFLLITGKPQREKIVQAVKSGISDVILKPVKTGELVTKMEALLKQRTQA